MSKFHTQDELLHFAHICNCLYQEHPDGVLDMADGCGLRDLVFEDIGDDEIMIGTMDHRTMVVCFMGSELTVHDWLSNFNFFSMGSGWGWKAHRGFLETAMKFDDLVRGYRESLGTLPTRVIFLGHSRGGAQSAFLANHLKEEFLILDEVELVTFGAPRVFKFSDIGILPVKKVTRVINNGDRVTKYPPAIFLFSHYGEEVHMDGSWWDRLPFVSIGTSHFLHFYIEKLKKAS